MKFKVLLFIVVIVFFNFGSAFSEVIHYEQVLSDAKAYSHKLAEAKLDQDIKEAAVRETAYLRYPEFSLKIYSEHVDDLEGGSGMTSVGGTVLADSSKFQNTAYIDFSYKLIDYGIRKNQVAISKSDLKATQALVKNATMDIEKTVLDIYSKILLTTINLAYKEKILGLMNTLNQIRQRTGYAGLIDGLTVMDRAIELEEVTGERLTLGYELSALLDDLSLYTGVRYDSESLVAEPLAVEIKEIDEIDFRTLPEYRYYEQLYAIKNKELDIEKKKFFPTFDVYMRYTCYGMDDDDYVRSFDEIREKNFTAGIYTTIPLMENFKRRHTLSRLRFERLKAETVMGEKYNALRIMYEKMKTNYRFYQNDLEHKQKLLQLVRDKTDMVARLTDAKVMDIEPGLEQNIVLLRQELDLEKQIVEKISALKQIRIQCEGAM